MKQKIVFAMLILIIPTTGCIKKPKSEPNADAQGHTAPTEATAKANAGLMEELPFEDQQDFADARKGLIANDPDLVIKTAEGDVIWDIPARSFIKGDAPAGVNPSLWRQAKLDSINGLFKVTDGIYQVRGFDVSNMTIIEGKTGWIIIDPLTTVETATAAIAFARKHLGNKPVKAFIFTHSHMDHFGGVLGIIDAKEVSKQNVPIVAPEGFMKEATNENIIAGIAMARRVMYMYGRPLAKSERGHIDTGLGMTVPFGTAGILEPTVIVNRTPQEMKIDGIQFIFQNAPDSEAPAELTFYLPDFKAFCGSEILSHTMHNLYTLRGAKVRNAVKWSGYINEAIELFGDMEIYFAGHHWPMWGNRRIIAFMKQQRDIYKYIHDQTVRLFNAGYTPIEIVEEIKLPESLRTAFAVRGYYGALAHNVRAVYQSYLGWYDANPARLNPIPSEDAGKRYVELMGGAEAVIAKAQTFFDKNEYRWTAELLNHLVFAEPDNVKAKALLARTYDQLGYQSESGAWRDTYLSAAYELRHGGPKKGILDAGRMATLLKQTPIMNILESMTVRLNGPKAGGLEMTVAIVFTDLNESYALILENSVLYHKKATPDIEANATIRLTHDLFVRMITGKAGIKDTIFSNDLKVEGSKLDLVRFFSLLDRPDGKFNIITP